MEHFPQNPLIQWSSETQTYDDTAITRALREEPGFASFPARVAARR